MTPLPRAARAVVLDLDGTLVDSAPDIADALAEAMAPHGLPRVPEDTVRGLLGGGARELVAGALRAAGADPALLDTVHADYSRAYARTPAARTTVHPGAHAALRRLREAGLAIGVCTNKRTALAHAVLAATGLAPLVDHVTGYDAVPAPKPDPGHLRAALSALGTDPEDAVYVGDTAIDARTAASAGVAYWHVPWGAPLTDPVRTGGFAALAAAVTGSPTPPPAPGDNRMHPQTAQDKAKWAAGKAAIDRYVRDGMKLGLGSGTTSHWFVRALGEAVAQGLDVVGVPTSTGTRDLALEVGVPLTTLAETERLDLTVDGADEIDRAGNMTKGGGACLLWERIVADASDRMVAVVDDSKVVDTLGAFPLPIEVVPYAWESTRRSVARLLTSLGYDDPELPLRERDGAPVTTDSGNYLLDAHLGVIKDPLALDAQLNWIPGVVENGLFTGIADEMVIGRPDGGHDVADVSASPTARPSTTRRGAR
ncbi:ribose-5-phosphate isomerase RpiA [Streptomyces sp. 7-21]|uniref:ribose-5-phosphate isomerase RpiA n=1 Tax=Streptomyces sp. 7-21 TaxID=2802283 RepID=UPI00191FAD33|nr:ribose-5-phosphate isomerase RpiA [Streptomyces sp. 7-21]MBL1066874.1 ribose-5-phosphate isomerase RpiA [Streptomyces sp. 7-21]